MWIGRVVIAVAAKWLIVKWLIKVSPVKTRGRLFVIRCVLGFWLPLNY